MNRIVVVIGLLVASTLASAQSAQNPVVAAAKAALARQSRNLTEAAQEMPADKYPFKPTPPQMSYGALVAHVARSNEFYCSKLAGRPANAPAVTEKDAKDKLVAALRASFDACGKDLDALTDASLGQSITLFGNRPADKATALLALTNDWADHYGTAAMYLRLNGLLPPTAKK